MLPELLRDFAAAAAKATPRGLDLVETAIDSAITKIAQMEQDDELDPETFSVATFIPKSAYGTAALAPALAIHHSRAHGVMKDTLKGVRTDLINFRAACTAAHAGIVETDHVSADDLNAKVNAVLAVGKADTSNADTAYDQAVQDGAGSVATETNPDQEGGA